MRGSLLELSKAAAGPLHGNWDPGGVDPGLGGEAEGVRSSQSQGNEAEWSLDRVDRPVDRTGTGWDGTGQRDGVKEGESIRSEKRMN